MKPTNSFLRLDAKTGALPPRGGRRLAPALAASLLGGLTILAPLYAEAAVQCTRTVTANVVVLDQPMMFNRLGAQNPNGMVYALKHDVINLQSRLTLSNGGSAVPGGVALRPDKRPRPLVLRVAEGDCLQVTLQNLLAQTRNPRTLPANPAELPAPPNCPGGLPPGVLRCPVVADEQVTDRYAGFQAEGMQLVNSIEDDSSYVGRNPNSLVPQGGTRTYTLYAAKEGVFQVNSYGASFGSEGMQGNTANGLFGAVMVEPKGGKPYRSDVTEEDLRLATRGSTADGQPIINYEETYPNSEPWVSEGKAGLPIINMMCSAAVAAASGGKCMENELVHSDINAIIMGPNANGSFPPTTYPLERVGKRNPTVPNRLEPFREFSSFFHDEVAAGQAFPAFYNDSVFGYVLEGVRDAFMINYGSGGIGSEIIANRLGVGPMYDCLDCSYEEFFLTAFTVGDPAGLVDVPANAGLEFCGPANLGSSFCTTVGPKANFALYPDDPSNVHHSYTGDFVKFRNLHNGKEQHIFHLHNHQWLYSPSDDDSNYLDAQGIGPGAGYTYEINFGGSGNRNKTAGDAIFHCHFYPHFAMGMWYLWRNHDVMETGTRLAASNGPGGFHAADANGDGKPDYPLFNGTPDAGARALPDGEVVAGTPIPAIVPLPGKAMAPMPGRVEVVTKDVNGDGIADSSQANVIDRSKNPGYPFWIAGMDCGGQVNDFASGLSSCASGIVGQRPPTPPLDMLDATKAAALKASGVLVNGVEIYAAIDPAQAGGHDGGLPRHSVEGVRAGGTLLVNDVNRLSFAKEIATAKAVFFPEEGTDLEKVAMAYHAVRNHPSTMVFPDGTTAAGNFVVNGALPVAGAPYHEPCIDDQGKRLTTAAGAGEWFASTPEQFVSLGTSVFTADKPRVYKAANVQFDAVLNKTGYHYPQQRIVALWEDVVPTILKERAPEPLVFRMNTLDCAMYQHTNLVPKEFEVDDYQVRTPTDIIGQHIHLPKWDLTTTDGAANGWNYEDGTLSPGKVQERIEAFNHFNPTGAGNPSDSLGRPANTPLVAQGHPFFDAQAPTPAIQALWKGARTTMQRWFTDPVLNAEHVDRGLGIIFSHDHFGPSTHQQIGLYSTLLTEPAGSKWVHNETGQQLGYDPVTGAAAFDNQLGKTRIDGGPTSWQAAILTTDPAKSFREFYLEFSDFQHAYEAGVYVGADQQGVPVHADINTAAVVTAPGLENTFRRAINPPFRQQFNDPVTGPFPDIAIERSICPGDVPRPCPQAISVADPGLLVVNYRIEPVALRVYDPNKLGPDGKPGMQADGERGDLAFALQSRTDRVIPELNVQPTAATNLNGTRFPPPINAAGPGPGDPFTPMMRAYAGDVIRVKIQAGAQEEENNATIHGMKWLQAGSGHGAAKNSGWRNSQAAGISEQFTLSTPIFADVASRPTTSDYVYSINAANDGWWNGTWGLIRAYEAPRADLVALPSNVQVRKPANGADFSGVCPRRTGGRQTPQRDYDVTAVLANDVLSNALGASIVPTDERVSTLQVGASLNPAGGTLVYNPRNTLIPREPVPPVLPGSPPFIAGLHAGPLHDPTAMMYVRTEDLEPVNPALADCQPQRGGVRNLACGPVRLRATAPVEPLVLRAAAGECINVTLRNRLPVVAPDLANFTLLQGVVKRDRDDPRGSTTFNNNLIRPSSHVGLHPQLVAYDVTKGDGANAGANAVQTVAPGAVGTFQWYAGDLSLRDTVNGQGAVIGRELVATPVEFGGFNLTPADRIKQGAKSLVGAAVILPQGATWSETDQVSDRQDMAGTRDTRASATVNPGTANEFRDFSVVMQKGLTQYYAGGVPVEHLNGEGLGIPEDSQESTNAAVNYATEPVWFRFQVAPNGPFENEFGGFGGVPNAHEAFSNNLAGVGGDPWTPVFTARPGVPFRMHVGLPHGVTRGSTFTLHGHVWQRAPYVCPGSAAFGIAGKCASTEVGSRALGDNQQSFYQGAQESITPYAHFDLALPSAGGAGAVPGDYLFRDRAGFGSASGLWGILRVE